MTIYVFYCSLLFYFPCILIVHMGLLYTQMKAKTEQSPYSKYSINDRLVGWKMSLNNPSPIIPASRLCGLPDLSSQMISSFVVQIPATNDQSHTSSHGSSHLILKGIFKLPYDCPLSTHSHQLCCSLLTSVTYHILLQKSMRVWWWEVLQWL